MSDPSGRGMAGKGGPGKSAHLRMLVLGKRKEKTPFKDIEHEEIAIHTTSSSKNH